MDSDALIKVAKGSLKELVSSEFDVVLSPEVQVECVNHGKAGRYPDAILIEENIKEGLLIFKNTKKSTPAEAIIKDLKLSGGEADTLRLYESGAADIVVSDDSRFLRFLEGLGIPFATPSSLLVALVRIGKVGREDGMAHLEKLSAFISDEEYLEARRALEAS